MPPVNYCSVEFGCVAIYRIYISLLSRIAITQRAAEYNSTLAEAQTNGVLTFCTMLYWYIEIATSFIFDRRDPYQQAAVLALIVLKRWL